MEFILKNADQINNIMMYLGYIVLAATVYVWITPNKDDDEKVSKIASWYWKVIHMLPTIGIHPQTQKLKKMYDKISNP